MALIPGLRSPYDQTSGIVYFGRMLDKIRLHARGELPPDYSALMGADPGGFDSRCLRFLALDHGELTKRTLEGGTDEEILEWAFKNGRKPTPEEIEIWNAFMSKRGWRDSTRERVKFRMNEAGIPMGNGVETMFDFIDVDEGRLVKVFPS